MDSEAEELRGEFDITRRELDEMAEELAVADRRMAEFARMDLQVGDLRAKLDEARNRHAQLDRRERALRAKFRAVIGDPSDRTH